MIGAAVITNLVATAASNPQAALALLSAPARQAYDALLRVPQLRQRLEAGWNEYNTAIETADTRALTPAERSAWNERVRQKGIYLQRAQEQLDRIDGVLRQATTYTRLAGIPVPPWPWSPRSGLSGPPLVAIGAVAAFLIVAAFIGYATLTIAEGLVATEVARAEQIRLGVTPPPSDLHTTARTGFGALAVAALLGLVVFMRRAA